VFVDVSATSDEATLRDRIPDEQRLLELLLVDREPAVRPVYNASQPVVVHLRLTLYQIVGLVSCHFFCPKATVTNYTYHLANRVSDITVLVRVVFDGGTEGHVPLTRLRRPLTGIDSVIPGWDAFNPAHWNEFGPSVSDMNPQQRRPLAQRCKKLTRTANEVSV